ncbi:MAG TPA: hypothetical protein VFG30_04820 [Polyangiales bacterium]|nr:hypothetical protein [Polyangiales bacterium]
MLESVLAACRRQVREELLLDALEAREAGVLERAYLRLSPAALRCEAWLIRWPPGSVAPLHDHGLAHGLAQVVTGTLHELQFAPRVKVARQRDWKPGAEIELPRGTYHEVRNRCARVAYSIHVYAPRLEHMTFYDRGAGGELRPVRQEREREWQREWQPRTTVFE